MLPVWGVLSVIGGFLYHLSLGYFYTIGNMNSYVISYMGITKSQSAWFSSVIIAFQAISSPIGGFMARKVGFRPVLGLGIFLSSGGIFLTRLTVDHGLGPYIFTYCVLFGLGMGFPYSVIYQVASSWFPEKRTTVVGIIASGLGLGALVFTPIQTQIINPDDIQPVAGKYPENVEQRIPNAFLILGGIVLTFQFIGFLLLRMRPEGEKYEDEVLRNPSELGQLEKKNTTDTFNIHVNEECVLQQKVIINYSVKDALRCIDFYILWIVAFCDIAAVVLLTSTYKLYGLENNLKDGFLSGVVMGSSVFNCIGRVTWGLIVDRISYKFPQLMFLFLWTILFATFPFVATGVVGIYLFAIWVFLLFFVLAGHFVILAGACNTLFGPKNFATIYGLVFLAAAPSGLLTAAVTSQLNLDGGWVGVYGTCSGFCALAFVVTLFLRDESAKCCSYTSVCSHVCNSCRNVGDEELADEYVIRSLPCIPSS